MEEQVEDPFANRNNISAVDHAKKTEIKDECCYDSESQSVVKNETDVKPTPNDIKFEEIIIKTEPFESVNRSGLPCIKEEIKDEFVVETKYEDFKITTENETDEANSTTIITEHLKSDDIDIKYEPIEATSDVFTEHGTAWSDSSDKVQNVCKQKDLLQQENVHLTSDDADSMDEYACDSCSFKTEDKSSYESHTLIHRGSSKAQKYKCPLCNYESKYKRYLDGHMSVHLDNTEKKMYKCGLCDYATFRKYSLTIHNLVHKSSSETNMYACDKCEFKTKYRHYLKKHQLIHDPTQMDKCDTNTELYKCGMCKFTSKYKGSLKTHILIHKDPSEVKMYRCIICGFKTKRKAYIKIHALKCRKINNVQCDTFKNGTPA